MNTPQSLELRSKLDMLKVERFALDNLPSTQPLIDTVNRLTAQHSLDPVSWRNKLEVALNELHELEAKYVRRARLNTEIQQAQVELDMELGSIRAAHIAAVERRYNEAAQQHRQDINNALRSYRQLLAARAAAGVTSRPPVFDSSMIRPVGWQGTVSDIVLQGGTLPHETEREEVAA